MAKSANQDTRCESLTTRNQNLTIWEMARTTPEDAKQSIDAGKLKGKSSINPAFRLQRVTNIFGPIGEGWKLEIDKVEEKKVGDEIYIIMYVSVSYKLEDGSWSERIPGIGTCAFVSLTKNGLTVNTDAWKCARTDAEGNAFKSLGIGADVYFKNDPTKYDFEEETTYRKPTEAAVVTKEDTGDELGAPQYCEVCHKQISARTIGEKTYSAAEIISRSVSKTEQVLCYDCFGSAMAAKKAAKPQPVEAVFEDAAPPKKEILCQCGSRLSDTIAQFSAKKYGKPLCMSCQKAVDANNSNLKPVPTAPAAAAVRQTNAGTPGDPLDFIVPNGMGVHSGKTLRQLCNEGNQRIVSTYASSASIGRKRPDLQAACAAVIAAAS